MPANLGDTDDTLEAVLGGGAATVGRFSAGPRGLSLGALPFNLGRQRGASGASGGGGLGGGGSSASEPRDSQPRRPRHRDV